MKLNLIFDSSEFLVIGKPSGLTTHQSTPEDWGYVEWVENYLKTKLFVVHRLDKDTSGVILFAKNSQATERLSAQWESRQVEKKYHFITDKSANFNSAIHKSLIEKKGKDFISYSTKEDESKFNSETHFKLISSVDKFYLWEAQPVTGKPHQIRLHAQDLGIPILGDALHGGSLFFRLCLHAQSLKISQNEKFESPTPDYFQKLNLCANPELCKIIDSLHRRDLVYKKDSKNECLRLLHSENDPIRVDQFGSQCWIYNYSEDPNNKLKTLKSVLSEPWIERQMLNRGQTPQDSALFQSENVQASWTAEENGIRYELRSSTGLSPGLFLDQRENRKWVMKNSNNKKVLNLFSYTGGFSLAAALGGAQSVTTVDVSKNFIEWSKVNFQLNQLDPNKYEFWVIESQEFIKICTKKNRTFDLIICDPPSLARNKSGVFKIEKDFPDLIKNLWQILNTNGVLFLSSNYEKWNQSQFGKIITTSISTKYEVQALPFPGLDFEISAKERLLKYYALKKI